MKINLFLFNDGHIRWCGVYFGCNLLLKLARFNFMIVFNGWIGWMAIIEIKWRFNEASGTRHFNLISYLKFLLFRIKYGLTRAYKENKGFKLKNSQFKQNLKI